MAVKACIAIERILEIVNQWWLTALSRPRSHMTSHIIAGRPGEKIMHKLPFEFQYNEIANQPDYFK